ncbi:MAG: hypothetical protein ABL956_10830 [Hyphomonadaceae bacterium]
MPADIKPWIDLLTWQVLALIGGVALLPAIYLFVLRIGSATIAGTEFKLTARDVDRIEDEAEELTKESTPQEAAAELTAPAVDDPVDVGDRLTRALTTWRNLQIIIKARARLVGGPEDLRAVIRNLGLLAIRFADVISRDDVNRAEELKENLERFREHPDTLTKQALRSFRVKTGRLARKIEEIPVDVRAIEAVG